MKLDFALTAEDYDAFHLDYYRHAPEGRRLMRRSRWLVPVVALVLVALTILRRGYDPVWVPALLGWAASWVLVFPRMVRWRIGRSNRRFLESDAGAPALAPRTVQLDEQGVHSGMGDADSRIGWSAIHRVGRGPQHLFLYLDGRQALIVPRRAFAEESEFEDCAELCALWAEQAGIGAGGES